MNETQSHPADKQVEGGRPPSRTSLISSLARAIDNKLSTGDVAQLRKLEPSDPSAPAFWRIVFGYLEPAKALPAEGRLRDVVEQRWAAVLSAMAIAKGLHQPSQRLGKALAEAQYSELRLTRLLRAEADTLMDLVRTTARMLAAKQVRFDAKGLADLIFSDGSDHAENVRRQIARDYYRNAESN